MDFNYYLHRQQVAQLQANAARSEPARRAHQELADAYGRLIEHEQRRRGAAASGSTAVSRLAWLPSADRNPPPGRAE